MYFLLFPKWLPLLAQFWCKKKNRNLGTAFLRYGNFIDDIITDWSKVGFGKKPGKNFGIRAKDYCTIAIGKSICDSTCRKIPVVRRLDFELWGWKAKICQR